MLAQSLVSRRDGDDWARARRQVQVGGDLPCSARSVLKFRNASLAGPRRLPVGAIADGGPPFSRTSRQRARVVSPLRRSLLVRQARDASRPIGGRAIFGLQVGEYADRNRGCGGERNVNRGKLRPRR